MQLIRDVNEFQRATERARQTARLGFVPTMGALHEGHLSLMRLAAQRADRVVVSIFVNPTQFGPNEDLSRYPRDLESDLGRCRSVGVDLVFAPEPGAMYAPNERTRVVVSELTRGLCGAHRPGHFDGVSTVVAKLFALVGPCVAVFGRKDYQQLKVIERMTRDLFLPVEVIGHPIVREPDGLAQSSRNRYLSSEDRERALGLSRGLDAANRAFAAGQRDPARLEGLVREILRHAGVEAEYVSCVDSEELAPWAGAIDAPTALLAVAAFVGKTRLIDNCLLGETLVDSKQEGAG